MSEDSELRDRIKTMIVRRLQLKMAPEAIADDTPLFREGLGLDSVEVLELVVGIEDEFGVRVGETDEVRARFFSVETLAAYVAELLQPEPSVAS